MIFKQETIQSWFSGVGSSINSEVIQPFKNAEQVIWKYNQAIQHNSLTQQGWERLLAQSDDSLKAYLTSIKGTAATMTGYNVSLQGNIIGFKKVSSAITQYNALSAFGAKEQNIFANAVSVTNGKLGTYLTGLKGAKASISGYVVSLVGATVKTVALKVATIALNSAITMGASLIISGLVSAISEWIHKTENMISASEDAIEKIKSINDELKNNQKTVSDTAKRYAELAQGVNQLTGENISLSNEDYEEFLTLSNQLAEMFPTLTRNYNDNGDAIVQLSGDVDTIVGSLQNLIEAQRDLANRQIVDELPTVFDGVAAKSDKYEQQLSDLKSRRDTLVKSLGDVQSEEFSSNFMDGFSNKWIEISGDNLEVISQMRDDYMKILKEANIDFEELTPTYEMKDGIEVPVGFTIKINSSDEDVEKAKNTIDGKIQELASQYETDINKLNEEIITTNEKNKANWTSLSSSIFAWLSTDDSFKVMDDTMQATVQNIVNSLDWGSLDFSSWEDAKQYIQENILSLFNTAEGKETLADIEVMFGIQTQFNNGDITVEQYQQKLQGFLNSIENLPPETKKSILLLFGIQTNDDGTTTSDVDTMVENVKKKLKGTKFDDKVGKLSLGDLKIAADLKVGDDTIQSWDELIAKIEEVKNASTNKTDISFTDVFNSSDFADSKDKLLNLAKSGELSSKTLSSTEEYADLLKTVGGNAELAQSKIMDMLSSTEKLSAASDGIGSLEDAYNEMKDDGFVLAKTLESLPDVFKDLQGFKSFSEIVGNPQSTADEMQQAFNDIASEYLITQNTLSGLVDASESEIQTYIANLKAMGITNAEEVVAQTTSSLQETESLINDAETEYYNAHIDYINGKTDVDANYLANVESNNSSLIAALGSTYQSDYQNWANLLSKKAEAYNEFVAAIGGSYNSAKTGAENLVANSKGKVLGFNDFAKASEAEANYQKSIADYNNAVSQLKIDLTKVNTNFGGGGLSYSAPKSTSSKGGGGGSDSSKEFSEEIDWIETKISRLEREITNLGKIADATWKTWTDRNKALAGEISKTTDEIKVQQQVYDRYMKAANDVGLDETYAKKVREGAIEIETITDEDLNNKISQYKDFYEKALDAKDAIADLQNQLADFVQTKFDNIVSEFDQLNAQIEHSIDIVNKKQDLREAWGLQTDPKRYADNNSYIKQQQKLLEQERNNLQAVMKEALSKGINVNSEQYINMLKQMNDLESQMKENEITMAENTVAIYTTAFDNVTENYDYLVNKIDHQINMMDKQMSLLEAKGRMGSMSYYEGNNNYLKKQQELITKEQLELQKVMKNALAGGLSVDSKQYKEWESQMNSLEEQLIENEVSIAENTKAMRELNEQYFEYQQELIQDVMDEVSFVGDVLSHKKLINDDGTFTSEGKASLGTSAINYDFAMAMADEYGKMVTAYEMLAEKDPNNTEIANKLSEYRKAQQDSINSALGYYEDMKSMVKDAFDQMIDNLNNIADKYIEGLNLQKDMYDYEKSIREKTDNISDLRRQIAAYSGDSSEETRGTLQTLYTQLQTAEEDLQETEYQRWLTDQQSMIDNMMQDAQEWEQAYLDSFEEYLDYWMDFINQNQLEIGDSIQEVLGEVGYLNNVSDSMNAILESIQSGETIVSSYDSKVYGELSGFATDALRQAGIVTQAIDNNGIRLNTISTIVGDIRSGVKALAVAMETNFSTSNTSSNPPINNNNSNNYNPAPSNRPSTTTPTTNTTPKPAPTPAPSQGNGRADVGDKVTLVSGKFYNTSGGGSPTGNSKGQYNGSQVYITKIAPGAKYPYHISTGNRLGSGDLGWISLDKLKGYATGGRNIMDELAWTQEDGGEIIRRSDGAILTPVKGATVFNAQQTDALWNLSKSLIGKSVTPTINPSAIVSNTNTHGDIHLSFEGGISMYGVNDPETFAKNLADSLNNNTRIKKIIQDNTLGVALGKNSLNGLRH